jgi:hypothetical protein
MPLTLGIAGAAGSLKDKGEPVSLGYRVNYVSNPSFEVDTTNWIATSAGTIARTTGQFNTGSASLAVTNGSGSSAQFGNSGTMIPFVAGEGTYYVSAYVKLAPGVSTANYWIRHLQYETQSSSGTVAAANIGVVELSVTGNWVRIGGSFSKSPLANFVILRVVTGSSFAGEIFYVDSVMLEKSGSLGSYFDGDSGGFWTGQSNNSFSGATPY